MVYVKKTAIAEAAAQARPWPRPDGVERELH
jgi:hypothetical protein